MTLSHHEFDDLERRLKAGWQWSDRAPSVSEQDLAQWVNQPTEHEGVEAVLAQDSQLRRAVLDLRQATPDVGELPSLELVRRVHSLVPDRPIHAGRIGLWAAAAAAAVMLAFGGWQLGSTNGTDGSLDAETLAFATFGLSDDDMSNNGSFLMLSTAMGEATQ